ncbi:hypothetical protein D3C73_1343860 [compost metagenome]
MQYSAWKAVQPGFEQRQETVMCVAAMHENRHLQLSGDTQLCLKRPLLLLRRGEIAIEIQPTFTNGDHFRLVCQRHNRLFR